MFWLKIIVEQEYTFKHIIFYTSSSKKEINNVKNEIIPYTKITVFSSNNSSRGSLAVKKDPLIANKGMINIGLRTK